MDMHPERAVSAGEEIITQGEPAMEAYLVMAGTFTVTLTRGDKTQTLATLGEGEIFGETALFKGSDYGATVTAASDGVLQPITPDILDERIKQCDPLLKAVIRMLMIRLRKANERLAEAL